MSEWFESQGPQSQRFSGGSTASLQIRGFTDITPITQFNTDVLSKQNFEMMSHFDNILFQRGGPGAKTELRKQLVGQIVMTRYQS